MYQKTSDDFGKTMLTELKLLEEKCNVHLSKFQKALLAEVGTLEQLLSIFSDSPIKVDLVRMVERDGEIVRRVALRNSEWRTLLLATTRYKRSNLPAQLYDDLSSGRVGVGSAIRRCGLETRRVIKKIGYDEKTKMLFREYEIIACARVIFSIREDFSIDSFRE